MLVFVLVCHTLCDFCLYPDEEEKAGCFALIAICLISVNVLWLLLMLPWVGLQLVIVVFPYHTHLLLKTSSFTR